MPLYEYECSECSRRTEVLQRFDEAPLAACPHCGGEVRRLISAPAFQFKGTGWYVTDYAGKKGGEKEKSGGEGDGAKPSAAGKDDGGKAEKAAAPEKKEKPAEAKPAE